MPVHHQMADLIAVLLSFGRAVKTARKNAFVGDQHAPDKRAVTGAALGYSVGDLHEVRIPVWAHWEILLFKWNKADYTGIKKRRFISVAF